MGHQAIGNDGEGIRGSVTIEKTTGHRRTIDPADEDRKMSSDTRKKSGQLVVSELIALLQLMPPRPAGGAGGLRLLDRRGGRL